MNLFSAPEHDIRNTKIMPCENHRNEFNCKTFFNVFATNPKIPVDELVTESYDSFKFNISNIDDDFINFQVTFTVIKFCSALIVYFRCISIVGHSAKSPVSVTRNKICACE